MRRLALALAILAMGCVHPPESRFPAVLQGPVLRTDAEFVAGAAATDAPLGPLELRDAWVRHEGLDARWHVEVDNPTSSGFGVTVVLRILTESGETTASDTLSFELDRGDTRELEGDIRLAATGAGSNNIRWRIEAWVRVLPAPDRRTLGGTG